MSMADQVSSELAVVASTQIAMSGHWVGALLSSVLGALFAAGTSVLGGTPLTRVEAWRAEAAGSAARALGRYLEAPIRVLSRWLAGRIACTALTAVLIGDAVRHLSSTWAVPTAILGTLATYGLLTEVVTTIARRNPPRAAPLLLRLMRPLELLAAPLAWPIASVAKLSGRLMPPAAGPDGRTTEQEVNLLVEEGQRAGTLGREHAEMIQNVLEFTDLTAVDVMVPRTKMVTVDAELPISKVLEVIAREGHSRYPVYRDHVDNVVGLLYAKDLFRMLGDVRARDSKVQAYIRTPVNFVPETQPVSRLLRDMRARRLHMAVVVDDYGGISGLVTLEDIVEQIVGDIRDEHDAEEDPVQDLGDGRLLVAAEISVDDLGQALGTDLAAEEGDFVSLGGMLIHEAGRVPAAGETIDAYGYRFIVREADERKVSKVEVVKLKKDGVPSGKTSEPPVAGSGA